jgi:hypothetical protein
MPKFICATCGVQYPASERPPPSCPVCEDERRFVRWEGQEWTTRADVRGSYRNRVEEVEPDLDRIGTEPAFRHRAARLPGPRPRGRSGVITVPEAFAAAAVTRAGDAGRRWIDPGEAATFPFGGSLQVLRASPAP